MICNSNLYSNSVIFPLPSSLWKGQQCLAKLGCRNFWSIQPDLSKSRTGQHKQRQNKSTHRKANSWELYVNLPTQSYIRNFELYTVCQSVQETKYKSLYFIFHSQTLAGLPPSLSHRETKRKMEGPFQLLSTSVGRSQSGAIT